MLPMCEGVCGVERPRPKIVEQLHGIRCTVSQYLVDCRRIDVIFKDFSIPHTVLKLDMQVQCRGSYFPHPVSQYTSVFGGTSTPLGQALLHYVLIAV